MDYGAPNKLSRNLIEKESRFTEYFNIDDMFRILCIIDTNLDKNKESLLSGVVFPTRPFTADEIAEVLIRNHISNANKAECLGCQKKKGGEKQTPIGEDNGNSSQDDGATSKTEDSAQEQDSGPLAHTSKKSSERLTLEKLGNYVRALRGTWVKPTLGNNQNIIEFAGNDNLLYLTLGMQGRKKVTLGLTNILTTEEAWKGAACQKPLLTVKRYDQIARIVNEAIRCRPRPDYLLFHELSLPRRWVLPVRQFLSRQKINLIAGIEYGVASKNCQKAVANEVHLALIDNRLGYDICVPIWHPKLRPAPDEEHELYNRFGMAWNSYHSSRVIYNHNGFFFTVLICSELQNSRDRVLFQGKVDSIIVPSWNRDLATFSALVKATALDAHCYVVLVNNRRYGDSRVRAPAKMRHQRDLARLRGGQNDFLVTVELNIDALRRFQSRAKRYPNATDRFKPLPEGFEIWTQRKKLPPA